MEEDKKEKKEKTGVQSNLSVIKTTLMGDIARQKFNEMLGRNSAGFLTTVMSVVNSSKLLKDATPNSIIMAAGIAASLNLPVNPNLGYAAIIPYKDNKSGIVSAQFQIMKNGFVELCQRTGLFELIINEYVHEGELVSSNKFTGKYEFDEAKRTGDKIIGYMAYFKLLNGFSKTMYMSVDEVKKHASKYSSGYRTKNGRWEEDFDSMALKTPLKLLLSKFAPKSTEIQRAILADQSVVVGSIENIEEAEFNYVDNETESISDKARNFLNEKESEQNNG